MGIKKDHYQSIVTGIQVLAGMCDGAASRDGAGFSGADASFGRELASASTRGTLTVRQCYYACQILQKYRKTQLSTMAIPTPAEAGLVKQEVKEKTVHHKIVEGKIGIWTEGYSEDFNRRAKAIAGHWYQKSWNGAAHVRTYPLSSAGEVNAEFGLSIDVKDVATKAAPAKRLTPKPDSGLIEIVNVKGLSGSARDGITYVGRCFAGWDASPLGNPFKLFEGKGSDIDVVISNYRSWLWEQLKQPGSDAARELNRLCDLLCAGVPLRLGCWCHPKPCHADVIKSCLEWMVSKRKQSEPDLLSQEATGAAESLSGALTSDFDHEYLDSRVYPYQKSAVEFLNECGGRGLVAFDMGLGKTAVSTSWLSVNPDKRPALIVCPSVVKHNWKAEIDMWSAHDERIHILSGTAPKLLGKAEAAVKDHAIEHGKSGPLYRNKHRRVTAIKAELFDQVEAIKAASIVIMNWDLLDSWSGVILESDFKVVVFDEVHRAKNAKSLRGKAFKVICKSVPHVIGLTGTPIMSRVKELYPLITGLRPEMFPNYLEFEKRYCNGRRKNVGGRMVWDFDGSSNLKELNGLLRPVMTRLTKDQALPDLPAHTRRFLSVDIAPKYVREYMALAEEARQMVKSGEKSAGVAVLGLMTEGLQIAARGKMDAIKELIGSCIESGEDVFVAARHTEIVDAIMEPLGDAAVRITGREDAKQKQAAADRFNNDESVKVLVGNHQAAGEGVNLQKGGCCNNVVAELAYVPSALNQVESRTHRNGQKNPVTSTYPYAHQIPIEKKIIEMLNHKQNIFDSLVDGNFDETAFTDSVVAEFLRG